MGFNNMNKAWFVVSRSESQFIFHDFHLQIEVRCAICPIKTYFPKSINFIH